MSIETSKLKQIFTNLELKKFLALQPLNKKFYKFMNLKEIQKLIEQIGMTKAAKQLQCGYLTLKKLCFEKGIEVKKKRAGRKSNLK